VQTGGLGSDTYAWAGTCTECGAIASDGADVKWSLADWQTVAPGFTTPGPGTFVFTLNVRDSAGNAAGDSVTTVMYTP
jgi:hypothetical protein